MCSVSTPFLGDKMARPFQHQSIYAQIITFRGHLKANGTSQKVVSIPSCFSRQAGLFIKKNLSI